MTTGALRRSGNKCNKKLFCRHQIPLQRALSDKVQTLSVSQPFLTSWHTSVFLLGDHQNKLDAAPFGTLQ